MQRAPGSFHDEGYGFDAFGLHPPSLEWAISFGAPLYERYFRVDSRGAERIPADGPAILVANHGGALPIDAAMLCLDVLRRTPRIPRAIADHFVPRLPLVSTLFARIGMVSGTSVNVRRLLERGELITVFPEGVSGPAKPFGLRYELQHWSVGFAEHAIRHRAPIIPVAIVGAEESWPVIARIRALRMFGAPYLPIPASPLPLPARFLIRYGEPIHADRGHEAVDAEEPELVARTAELARAAVARLLAETLDERRGVFL
ncbi:MAG: acyltransferase family protein [Myxococcales bacterium]|nr:acyltransferase family protein [Myxococcales bacterium]